MTINHRAEALRLLTVAHEDKNTTFEGHNPEADRTIAEAQVHATLARDEDQATRTADLSEALYSLRRRFNDARALVARHIAEGLASREKDRWKAAIDLTKALDEAHCNLDDLVDDRLTADGWDPRSAYKTPAGLAPAGWAGATPERDPWTKAPDITAQVPEPVRRVLAEYLAAALLSKGDAQGVGQTITFALKHVGADLTGDIEKRITELTLGADPSDPPF
ncbi:hypothetical protein [Streptomyces swartbergensis]|uniref:Uncharacterized protein n=1 Tax=Streptomyces swartbergensis TaxID=487165 RepID=A0A243S759_9ACTN|nr:hypothetical protein [Streptomyces swartbergensis]OUD03359.1 hypothetical protein CA983_10135 [Streptomyces swartbergensis]